MKSNFLNQILVLITLGLFFLPVFGQRTENMSRQDLVRNKVNNSLIHIELGIRAGVLQEATRSKVEFLKNDEQIKKQFVQKEIIQNYRFSQKNEQKHEKTSETDRYYVRTLNAVDKNTNPKTSRNAIQRLDSIVVEGGVKEEFVYDINGNLTQLLYSEWDVENEQWNEAYRFDFTYDVYNRVTQRSYYSRDIENNQWVGDVRFDFAYDVNGEIIQVAYYYWDFENNQWIIGWGSKSDVLYDTYGNVVQIIVSSWDSENDQWVQMSKYDYTYDVNGDIAEEINSFWSSEDNQWIETSKYDYMYDANGNYTEIRRYYWEDLNNEWIESYRSDYTYDVNGNKIEEFFSQWYPENSQWIVFSGTKYDYTYDVNSVIIQEILFEWDVENEQWIEISKSNYAFGISGEVIEEVYFEWDAENNQWVAYWGQKYDYTYDFDISIDDLIVPEWYDNFSYKILSAIDYSFDEDNWVMNGEGIFYYSDVNTNSLQNNQLNDLIIYPNPAINNVTINIANGNAFSLEIIDLQGKVVVKNLGDNGVSLDISHLNSGMYVYVINNQGVVYNGKLIKK
jgi:hypothetical protein